MVAVFAVRRCYCGGVTVEERSADGRSRCGIVQQGAVASGWCTVWRRTESENSFASLVLMCCAVEYGPEMAMWFRHSLNCAAINPPSITNSVMGSSKSPQVRGADKARTGREVKKFGQTSSFRPPPKTIPKWTVTEYKPPRKISVRAAPIQCSRRTRARAIFIITPFLSHAVVLARSLVARRTRSSRPRGKCFLTWTATAAVRSTRRSLA